MSWFVHGSSQHAKMCPRVDIRSLGSGPRKIPIPRIWVAKEQKATIDSIKTLDDQYSITIVAAYNPIFLYGCSKFLGPQPGSRWILNMTNAVPQPQDIIEILFWLVVRNIFYFPYIGNNHPNWLILFRGVETTNQYLFDGQYPKFYCLSLFLPTLDVKKTCKLCICQAICGNHICKKHIRSEPCDENTSYHFVLHISST